MQDFDQILQENNLTIIYRKILARFFISCKKSFINFLVQDLQDLAQDLASLARKILARFRYFLQDSFYWERSSTINNIILYEESVVVLQWKHHIAFGGFAPRPLLQRSTTCFMFPILSFVPMTMVTTISNYALLTILSQPCNNLVTNLFIAHNLVTALSQSYYKLVQPWIYFWAIYVCSYHRYMYEIQT